MEKNRKAIFLIFLYVLPIIGFPQEKGVRFVQGLTWQEILAKAKNENKYIFMDCYASWCKPCKAMDKNVYENDTVGQRLSESFISVKIQFDTTKNDDEQVRNLYGTAKEINQKYYITAFPTFLFFSPDGKIVHREVGYKDPQTFITLANDALDSNKQYYTLLNKFNMQNPMDSAALMNLINLTAENTDEAQTENIVNRYLDRLEDPKLFTKDNLSLMAKYTRKSSDRGFNIFRYRADTVFKLFNEMDPKYLKSIVEWVIYTEEIQPQLLSKNGKPDWEKISSNLSKYDTLGTQTLELYRPSIFFNSEIKPLIIINPEWNKILITIRQTYRYKNIENVYSQVAAYYENFIYHTKNKDCKDFVTCCNYINQHFPKIFGAPQLNEIAWVTFQYSLNNKELSDALNWSKRAVYLEGSGMSANSYLDTYANLLYKLGRKQEAIMMEKKALSLVDDPDTKVTLKKMEENKPTW